MLTRIFPKTIDNRFRGLAAAAWILGLVLFVKFAMSATTMFDARATAAGSDGIPLDSFPPAAAAEVVNIFQLLGLDQMMLAVVGLIALVRYRSMIPLAYLLLIAEHLARKAFNLSHAQAHAGPTPVGVYVNLALLAVMLLGFVLSLMERRQSSAVRSGPPH
jgi:hypothetical protein